MNIVFAASECTPYAKTGGLGDVVGALPRALADQGHRVSVFIPYYREVARRVPLRKVAIPSVTIPFQYYNRYPVILDGGKHLGVQMYFVECAELFDRDNIYGDSNGDYPDNAERFGLFARAVLESSKLLGVPDVFHIHDWPTSILAVMLRTLYMYDPQLGAIPCVLTIHNAGYQGWFPPRTVEQLLLPWEIFTKDRVELYDTFNFLKGGIVYSDYMTAVSPRYAQEIQTREFASDLAPIFHQRHWDLRGILNGVDYSEWNPETDTHIAAHYSASDLSGKTKCRRDLLEQFGMNRVPDESPIFGIVTRFAEQKGLDLMAAAIEALATREDAVVAVLGSGDDRYEKVFQALQARYPERVCCYIGYNNALAHKIEAGADMFLMPSRYEPCGLNQIYSLRYGTVPIVRATGGLDDTIEEWNPATGTGNGFKFYHYDAGDFLFAIHRALQTFRSKPAWAQLVQNGMAQRFPWSDAARQYAEVYQEVLRRRGRL
jgi:starch synthase